MFFCCCCFIYCQSKKLQRSNLAGHRSSSFKTLGRQFAAWLAKKNKFVADSERRRLTGPAGTPSRGGDVTVCVLDINHPSFPLLLLCSCVCFCLYGPFNCIWFHKFSRQLSAFSLCFPGLIPTFFFFPFFSPYWSFQLYIYLSLWKSPSAQI